MPEECRWGAIKDLQGEALATRYSKILDKLSRHDGLIGALFLKAQNEIQDPAKLRRLVTMIGEETWLGLDLDTKGTIYEGLLERNAAEVKSGAGQYFTPRPLIDAMVEVIDPQPSETVHDPACGTGGFLLAAWERMKKAGDRRSPVARARQAFRHRHRARRGAAVRHEYVSARRRRATGIRSCAPTRSTRSSAITTWS